MDDRQLIANAMQFRACIAHDIGEHDRAVDLLKESESLWREVGNRMGIAEALTFMGNVQLDLNDPERAGYKPDLAAVRTALGKETFAAAWTEGLALSMEQACAYANEETS